jgi:endoglucanase
MEHAFRTRVRLIPMVAITALAAACVDGSGAENAGKKRPPGCVSEADAGVAQTMAKSMGMGVNIGNTLDNTSGTWETGWGQPLITQAYIDGMASHGIKTVRVPVAWDTYAEDEVQPDGTVRRVIPPDKMARVQQVVQWIIGAGMYAIVNIHWDRGWIDSQSKADQYRLTDDVRAKFASYWTQIAAGFTDVDDHLVFEAMNEEGVFYVGGDQSKPDYPPLNELNQTFVNTVRAGGGFNTTRALLVAGFATDIGKTCVNAFAIPCDPAGDGKLFLSLHYYDPATFCILEQPASYGMPATVWGSATEQAQLQTKFNGLAAFAAGRNIPVIIGEFSVTRGYGNYVRESASRIRWIQSVASAAFANNMVPVLWDTGSDVNRTDGSLSSDFQTVMTQLGL